ncbi:DUF3443 domain-containing protein [Burkholderia ubonensis]|uniref:DUF3443 domain-containing protein n=1 Tax=Burkholderia ubonensis TaxID=101571 RepID=UPI0012F981E1|nr:DUF3443 domain-containing protein [Burkholderia ubonensis]
MKQALGTLAIALALVVAGCDGGDSANVTSARTGEGRSTGGLTPGSTVISGSSSSSGFSFNSDANSSPTVTANVVAVTVGSNPFGNVNIPMASVTICVPGTTSCQTVDNVMVDTGSYGLRLMASAVTLALPQSSAANGGALVECAAFGSGVTWGSVRTADVKLAGEIAAGLPIQLIGDSNYSTVPTDCSNQGSTVLNTASVLRANGILGVGAQSADCPACTGTGTAYPIYFNCSSASSCGATNVASALQVSNPVSRFATDNNGVVVALPSVPSTGSTNVSGTLTFGIGTQSNNVVGSATIYQTAASSYTFNTVYGNTTYSYSFIDSGSNGLFFSDASIPQCNGNSAPFYCPTSSLALSATIKGLNGATALIRFGVANMQTLVASGAWAMNDLAASVSGVFDWGLPFFFGRTVYVAIAGQSTPSGTGPYVAF